MITKILVPTDGSERAEHAAEFAISLAKHVGAGVYFLSVVDEVAPAYTYELESAASFDIAEISNQRLKFGEEAVTRLKEKAEAAGVTAEAQVLEGHPWQKILAEVERVGADHIVIGSHGRRALAAAVLGNVTVNVIHGAQIPVTVIPWHEKE